MKRHNKEVLRAALFALISIFVMVGAAGLLYKEHKKKLEKERMAAAALWALESVPQAVYAPKLTVTPQPSGETEAVKPEKCEDHGNTTDGCRIRDHKYTVSHKSAAANQGAVSYSVPSARRARLYHSGQQQSLSYRR